MNKKISIDDATVIDVRSPWEYDGAHVAGSINIPLNEIPERIDEIRALHRPLVFCCASGNRSGQATAYLERLGFSEVYNGGSWLEVNALK